MARKALTQQTVDRLRPDPTKVVERPDHLYPALRLVVQPSGSRSFAVRTRIGGKPVKITLKDVGLDLKEAREETRKILKEVAAGGDPRRAKLGPLTLGAVVELYLADKDVRPRTMVEIERHLRRRWAPLHRRPIAEIRRGEVAARLLEIKQQHGPIAANRARASLRAMFAWAMDKDLIEANVVAATRKPAAEHDRDRVLSIDELRAIWAAAADDPAVRLLALTGQREGEVGGCVWAELDLDKAIWALPAARTKNRLPHVVPLSRQAVDLIAALPRRGDRLFPGRSWAWAKRRLDERLPPMPHWTVHDLRRSLVTSLNDDLGIAPHIVEAAVNHQSGAAKRGVAGTYNRAQYLRERTHALQAWADYLTAEPVQTVVRLRA